MPRKAYGGRKGKKVKAEKIQIGNHCFTWGKKLSEMEDSTQLYLEKDFKALRLKLEIQGYIFIRGVVPLQKAQKARDLMLKQAAKDGSIINTKDTPYSLARMAKQDDNKTWQEGYCVDGITGTETNERDNIDTEAWRKLGPSQVMKDVYMGDEIKFLWNNLFGDGAVSPLPKQTFIRLMGDSATQEHADYYYFKKDTHIFSGKDGRGAIAAAEKYRLDNKLPVPRLDAETVKNLKTIEKPHISDNSYLFCHICERFFLKSSLDKRRLERLAKGGFGVSGEWHCPECASSPMAIYTSWICLSNLSTPRDSILGLAHKTHDLGGWDVPKPRDRQLCSDFNWKFEWFMPSSCGLGDVILFNIKTIHASSLNVTVPRTYRASCDTRILLTPTGNSAGQVRNDDESSSEMKSEDIDRRMRKNPSPHPPLSVVKRRSAGLKFSKGTVKKQEFGSDEESETETSSGRSAESGNEDNECKTGSFSIGNDEACGQEKEMGPRMVTRSQARRMKENMAKMSGQGSKNGSRKTKSAGKKGADLLTDSMSDLRLV